MQFSKISRRLKVALLTAAVAAASAAATMLSTHYKMTASAITSTGSGVTLSSTTYKMGGALGQFSMATMSGGSYVLGPGIFNSARPPQATLDHVHPFPNPYRASRHINITFANLTQKATVRIYTVSGELVRTLDKNSNDDVKTWDVRNENGEKVVSGLYVFLVTSGSLSAKGKLIIIR